MWLDEHGIMLHDGEKRKSAMEFACESMREPLAHEFTATMFSSYRKKRLSGEIVRTDRVKQISPRTMNLELAYFRVVFNELKGLGHWKLDNQLSELRPFKSERQSCHIWKMVKSPASWKNVRKAGTKVCTG